MGVEVIKGVSYRNSTCVSKNTSHFVKQERSHTVCGRNADYLPCALFLRSQDAAATMHIQATRTRVWECQFTCYPRFRIPLALLEL